MDTNDNQFQEALHDLIQAALRLARLAGVQSPGLAEAYVQTAMRQVLDATAAATDVPNTPSTPSVPSVPSTPSTPSTPAEIYYASDGICWGEQYGFASLFPDKDTDSVYLIRLFADSTAEFEVLPRTAPPAGLDAGGTSPLDYFKDAYPEVLARLSAEITPSAKIAPAGKGKAHEVKNKKGRRTMIAVDTPCRADVLAAEQ